MLYCGSTKIENLQVNSIDCMRVFCHNTLVWHKSYDILNSLHFTGSQWIDIGFTPNKNSVITMNAHFLDVGYCGYDTQADGGGLAIGRQTGNQEFCIYTYTQQQVWMGDAGNAHIYYVANGVQKRDDEIRGTRTWTATSSPLRFYLGALNTDYNGVAYKCNMWLSRFIVTENGVSIYDLWPARRKLDGVVGIYNTVSDIFYAPSGGALYY